MILTEVEKQGLNVRRRIGELVAVQGFGRPVVEQDYNINEASSPEARLRASPRTLRI